MPKVLTKPSYTYHKPLGQARCRIDGKDDYLGPYGSPESREQYDDLVADWLSRQDTSRVGHSIDDLCLLFLQHAESYYRHRDGTPTGEAGNMRHALRFLDLFTPFGVSSQAEKHLRSLGNETRKEG